MLFQLIPRGYSFIGHAHIFGDGLDSPASAKICKCVLETPQEYVLKFQKGTSQGDRKEEQEAFESQLICWHVCKIVCYLAKLPLKQIIASPQ